MAEAKQGIFVPTWPIHRDVLTPNASNATPHDSRLYGMRSDYGALERFRQEFIQGKAEIVAREAAGELGPVGVKKELSKLTARYTDEVTKLRGRYFENGKKRIAEVTTALTTPRQPENETPYQQVSRAMLEDRTVRRHEALLPAQRREAVRQAKAVRDRNYLRIIRNEPGLLPPDEARGIDVFLLEGGDPKLLNELHELQGHFTPDGSIDPTRPGAVPVLGYALDATEEFFHKEAGEQAAPQTFATTEDAAILLSRAEAKDVGTYRAAAAEAKAKGVELRIAPEENQGSPE